MKKINVRLLKNPYTIYIEWDLIKNCGQYIKKLNLGNRAIILVTQKILDLYPTLIPKYFKGLDAKVIPIINGERAKSRKWLFHVIDKIIEHDILNKKVFIICLGGGTIGDLGGFAASLYKRGIPCVQVPTTLLSQVDASIGGKTAIDLKAAKNIIGTIYQPKAVFIDPIFLKTLPKKCFIEGLAEVIKYGIIQDKQFFWFLHDNHQKILEFSPQILMKIIATCAKIKADVVKQDETENKGIRTILNFGHTLAHALEASFKYKRLSHGEAVSIGMLYAAHLSYLLKMCSKQTVLDIHTILKLFSLPTKISIDMDALFKAFMYDKKFTSGKIRMVLLNDIGQVKVVENISLPIIRKALKVFSLN